MWMSLVNFQVLGSHPDALGWGIICFVSPKKALWILSLPVPPHITPVCLRICSLWLDISAMMLSKSRAYYRPLKFPHEGTLGKSAFLMEYALRYLEGFIRKQVCLESQELGGHPGLSPSEKPLLPKRDSQTNLSVKPGLLMGDWLQRKALVRFTVWILGT